MNKVIVTIQGANYTMVGEKSEKEMLTIKDAGHAKSSEVDPETYWTTVYNFTNKYISN